MSTALTTRYDTFEGSCPLLEHPPPGSIHLICHLEHVSCSIFKLWLCSRWKRNEKMSL